jgi:hypothetical protein
MRLAFFQRHVLLQVRILERSGQELFQKQKESIHFHFQCKIFMRKKALDAFNFTYYPAFVRHI